MTLLHDGGIVFPFPPLRIYARSSIIRLTECLSHGPDGQSERQQGFYIHTVRGRKTKLTVVCVLDWCIRGLE